MKRLFTTTLALLFLVPFTLQAQDSYLNGFLQDFNGASEKLVSLAEATDAETFAWSPEGARSVGEVYLHVAGGNFNFAQALGVDAPEDLNMEITEKEDIIETLKASQENVRQAVEANMGKDLSEEVEAFGRSFPRAGIFMIIGGHSHEHLGQSIAYARMNGITPPWSQ